MRCGVSLKRRTKVNNFLISLGKNLFFSKCEISVGRHFPGMLKEQCVKFPSGSSEISWFLNEDSGPMMMMMMNLVTNMMIMGRWDSWMVERNAELFGVSQSTDRKVSDQMLIQISTPPLVQQKTQR